MARKGKPGWFYESARHGLAAKGIKTETKTLKISPASREYAERAVKIIKDYGGEARVSTIGGVSSRVYKQPRELGEWVELTDKGGRIWLSTTGSRISPEDAKDYIKEMQLALTIIDTIERPFL